MSNNERLPEEFWGVRLAKRLLNLPTSFTASFEDSKLVMFREQQTKIKTPANPLFQKRIKEKSTSENSQVLALPWQIRPLILASRSPYLYHSGAHAWAPPAFREYQRRAHRDRTREHEYFLTPSTFAKIWILRTNRPNGGRTDRSVYSRSMHANNDLCGDKTHSRGGLHKAQMNARSRTEPAQTTYIQTLSPPCNAYVYLHNLEKRIRKWTEIGGQRIELN